MPDTPSIVTVKKFTYRGNPEEWSNKYHFSGTTPADAAAWKTLADAVIAEEKKLITSLTSIVRAYGYVAGNENSVAQIDYTVTPLTPVVGTLIRDANEDTPGDVAWVIRWSTPQVNSRGKRIYCRKFFHDARQDTSGRDAVSSVAIAAGNTFAAKMIDGTLPGNFRYCGPQGAVLSNPKVMPYLTTRTLKRRGKRPPLPGG